MTIGIDYEAAKGLALFAAGCAAIRSGPDGIVERLADFLTAAAPMLVNHAWRRAPVADDPAGFTNAMTAIALPLSSLREAGLLADPWALARLKRREVANAGVLAGLWSPASGGRVATEFLSAFLERLRPRPDGAALPDRFELDGGYLVRTEDRPMGDSADRIDITIEGRGFLVGIEVKIDAGLQPDQLGRYQVAIRQRAEGRGKRPAVIFLSLRHTTHPGVLNAGWDDVAAAARTVVTKRSLERDINHHLIERFAAHVARF
jgi:hypothetical protein